MAHHTMSCMHVHVHCHDMSMHTVHVYITDLVHIASYSTTCMSDYLLCIGGGSGGAGGAAAPTISDMGGHCPHKRPAVNRALAEQFIKQSRVQQ